MTTTIGEPRVNVVWSCRRVYCYLTERYRFFFVGVSPCFFNSYPISGRKWNVQRSFLFRRKTAPLPALKRVKKHSRSLVAVWLLLRDFLFGGVTIVSSSGRSSSCFYQSLPLAVSVSLSGDGSGATRMRPQVGSRVVLLLHTFPSHRKTAAST